MIHEPQAREVTREAANDSSKVVKMKTASPGHIPSLAIVEVRHAHGVDRIYPVNDVAKGIAKLAGTTTLTQATINIAKDLGFVFEEKQRAVRRL